MGHLKVLSISDFHTLFLAAKTFPEGLAVASCPFLMRVHGGTQQCASMGFFIQYILYVLESCIWPHNKHKRIHTHSSVDLTLLQVGLTHMGEEIPFCCVRVHRI